jgi:hypothetical protein
LKKSRVSTDKIFNHEIEYTGENKLQIGGASSSSAAGGAVSFGSAAEKLSASSSPSHVEKQLKSIYKDVMDLRKALEEIENPLRLRSGKDDASVMSKTKAGRIADLIEDVADAVNNLFDKKRIQTYANSDVEQLAEEIRGNLKAAVSNGFDSDLKQLSTEFGITFDFGLSAKKVIDFSYRDRNELVRQLTDDGSSVNDLFFKRKSKDDDGLVEKMLNALAISEEDLKDILGTSGLNVDTTA